MEICFCASVLFQQNNTECNTEYNTEYNTECNTECNTERKTIDPQQTYTHLKLFK